MRSLSDHLPRESLFGARSVWREDVSRAPLNPDSDGLVANLSQQVRDHYGGVAALNIDKYSVAFYEVSSKTPRQTVRFDDCQGKGSVPPELYATDTNSPFKNVPIPSDAVSASGTDGEITLWSPSTDQLWELWKARKVGTTWHACWGGQIDHVSSSDGQFPGATGVSASGLAIASGVLGIREARAGRIDHALGLGLVDVANYRTHSYPATRSDGTEDEGTPHAIAEGTRFRLDPTVDVDALDLTPTARAIARAAQTYGFIVTDRSGAVAIGAERGTASRGRSPWDEVLGDTPHYLVLKNFPWDRLQALPFDYGRS